jgi:hypothetical protein
MTSRRPHNQTADHCALVGIDAGDISNIVAQWWLANAFRREFVLWRIWARISEEEPANKGEEQKPTERGPDKRPQGAARSVGCSCLVFSLIGQCAASSRNVRASFNTLLELPFPHIAEAGNG